MRLHKAGLKIMPISFLLLAGLWTILYFIIPGLLWLKVILLIAALVFFGFIVNFFRNPIRNTIIDKNNVICPADGKIVVIEETEETEYFKDKRRQISIFMSPLNVHVNRNPVSGKVKYFKYHPGKFLVAWHPKSSTLNERTTVVFELEDGTEVLVRQIAGAVARRIRWYIKENDPVTQGEDFGFITFGSRVDVFLPLDAKINVDLNQDAIGGEMILAKFR